ncbi:MAG: nucleotidyltransferase domain-containing protein, partial [Planctomycetota bacterium]
RRSPELPIEAIAELCRKYQVEELSVFGSVLRGDFRPNSDVDFLVTFKNNDYGPWMGKLTEMEQELASILGRTVDLVDKVGIRHSRNWIRRKAILESAQVIYAA